MGTTTALLHWGDRHPYDGGLWGDFGTLKLVEGDRCAWVNANSGQVCLASPQRILLDGLRMAAGEAWTGFPERDPWENAQYKALGTRYTVVLAILQGSSLRADDERRRLGALGVPHEVLHGDRSPG